MAKTSAVVKNERRIKLAKKYASKRAKLKAIAADQTLPANEQFEARLKLQKIPRNSNPNRIKNRCGITGRPRGYYRKFGMSRIALRELASNALIPGVTKSSW